MSDVEEARRTIREVAGRRKTMAVSVDTLEALVLTSIRLGSCKITPRVKPEMSPQEKNAAMDAAIGRFIKCITKKYQR